MNVVLRATLIGEAGQVCISYNIDRAYFYKNYTYSDEYLSVAKNELDDSINSWSELAEKVTDEAVAWRLKGVRVNYLEGGWCNGLGFNNYHMIWLVDPKCPGVGGPPLSHNNEVVSERRCSKFSDYSIKNSEKFLELYRKIVKDGFISEVPLPSIMIPKWRLLKTTVLDQNKPGKEYEPLKCIRHATSLVRKFNTVIDFSNNEVLWTQAEPWYLNKLHNVTYQKNNIACSSDVRNFYLSRLTVYYSKKSTRIAAIDFMYQHTNGSGGQVNGIGKEIKAGYRNTNPVVETGQGCYKVTQYMHGWILELTCARIVGVGTYVLNNLPGITESMFVEIAYNDDKGNKVRTFLEPIYSSYFNPLDEDVTTWYSPPAATLTTDSYQPHVIGFHGWVDQDDEMSSYVPIWAYEQNETHHS